MPAEAPPAPPPVAPTTSAPPPAPPRPPSTPTTAPTAMGRMLQKIESLPTTTDPNAAQPHTTARQRASSKPASATPETAKPQARLPQTPTEGDQPQGDQPGTGETAAGDQPQEGTTNGTPPKPTEGKPTGKATGDKPNPWKLVDNYKAKAGALERELAEFKKSGFTPELKQQMEERAKKAETRVQELEKELIFHDYSKSPEFAEKYEKPYEAAWTRAMGELKELTLDDGSGHQRAFNANDMLRLVNLPLAQARALAQEQFGEFVNDIMGHRKEIRSLLEQRQQALTQAHENGAAELRKRMETQQASRQETLKFIGDTWQSVNKEVLEDPAIGSFFKPSEGDDEGNAALERGFKLVDEAFAATPEDPRLTPEQRREVIRKHAAIRNRAAAFGRMRHQIALKDSKIKELESKLKGYEETEPTAQGREAAPETPPTPGNRWEAFQEKLNKLAR